MFIVLLKFAENKSLASQFMDGHNQWIKRGFDEGIFLLVGSLQPNLGGSIIAHNTNMDDLKARVDEDPFVKESIVKAQILEISPKRVDARLSFLEQSSASANT